MTSRAALYRPLVILALMLMAWVAGAEAQPAARRPNPTRIRVVVFQFSGIPDDQIHRTFAATVARSLVRSLVADSAFHVMTNPRAAKDPSNPAGDAQYGLVGSVAELNGALTVEVRVLDLQRVALLGRESLALTDASSTGTLALATTELAGRIRSRINTAPLP